MKRPPNCDQDRGGEAGRLRLHVERRNGEADSDEDDLERLLDNMRR